MAERPTEVAEKMFQNAGIKSALPPMSPEMLARVLYDISRGLEAMAVGLRATYQVLDEMNRRQLQNPRPNQRPSFGP